MKISAIICEYNPMHAGHLHHIEETKRLSGADKVICIMSGSFTQRGEPAIFDKFARTKAALSGGADLVIELPTSFCCASAEKFAYGGVFIADSCKIVSHLSFGCENADADALKAIASSFNAETQEYKAQLKLHLKSGASYPSARAEALNLFIPGAKQILSSPNNILAVEYLKALERLKSKIEPVLISRKGSGYLESEIKAIPSALAIRNAVFSGAPLSSFIPKELYSCFSGLSAVHPSTLFFPAMFKLRTMSNEELTEIDGVDEGLEYRLKSACKIAKSYDELISLVKTKRYPQTRIKRIILNIILDIKKAGPVSPSYIRILGVKKESRELLSMLSKSASLPVIISPVDVIDHELKRDIIACDIRALLQSPSGNSSCDFTTGLIVL